MSIDKYSMNGLETSDNKANLEGSILIWSDVRCSSLVKMQIVWTIRQWICDYSFGQSRKAEIV